MDVTWMRRLKEQWPLWAALVVILITGWVSHGYNRTLEKRLVLAETQIAGARENTDAMLKRIFERVEQLANDQRTLTTQDIQSRGMIESQFEDVKEELKMVRQAIYAGSAGGRSRR